MSRGRRAAPELRGEAFAGRGRSDRPQGRLTTPRFNSFWGVKIKPGYGPQVLEIMFPPGQAILGTFMGATARVDPSQLCFSRRLPEGWWKRAMRFLSFFASSWFSGGVCICWLQEGQWRKNSGPQWCCFLGLPLNQSHKNPAYLSGLSSDFLLKVNRLLVLLTGFSLVRSSVPSVICFRILILPLSEGVHMSPSHELFVSNNDMFHVWMGNRRTPDRSHLHWFQESFGPHGAPFD